MASPELKKYGWAILGLFAFLAAWLILPFTRGTGEDAVSTDMEAAGVKEQSLRSLDEQAPASVPSSANSTASTAFSGGLSAAPSQAKPVESLAKALKALSRSSGGRSSSYSGAWSGQPLDRQGAASPASSAENGVTFSPPSSSPDSERGSGAVFSRGAGMDALDRTAGVSAQDLSGKDEQAAELGKRSFDLASRKARALMERGGSGGARVGAGDVPVNLKAYDPQLGALNLVPPTIGPSSETKDKNKQYMEQQFVMMLIALAVGGFLGPSLGAAGAAIAQSFGINPPTEDALHRVRDTSLPT